MKNLSSAILVCFVIASVAFAQTQVKPAPQPSPQDIDVVRVSTELVQTDVMVFDKGGHFVDGLQREQFELKVDGKPQSVSLFDRVVSGSEKEEQLVSHKDSARAGGSNAVAGSRGRAIIFFIDDLHLSASSVLKTRQAILSFFEKVMSVHDRFGHRADWVSPAVYRQPQRPPRRDCATESSPLHRN
jgi:hypothetical protein